MIRGNKSYGINEFADKSVGSITDNATDLLLAQDDNGNVIVSQEALSYAENGTDAGYTDCRLPGAKELQSNFDYTRLLDEANSAVIDPLFSLSEITNEAGQADFTF